MAEPAPRRYLTRSRAKQCDDTTTARPGPGPKRRALGEGIAMNNSPPKPLRTITLATGLKAAPKRRAVETNNTEKVPATPASKKVTFASPGNKENAAPSIIKKTPLLSAKPKRVPKSELKQPGWAAPAPLPAMSPQKAIRPIQRPKEDEDEDMTDELTLPAASALSVKPIRPKRPAQVSDEEDELASPHFGASALFSSPAKRLARVPMQQTTAREEPVKRSALGTPARRPQGARIQGSARPASTLRFQIRRPETPEDEEDVPDELTTPGKRVLFQKEIAEKKEQREQGARKVEEDAYDAMLKETAEDTEMLDDTEPLVIYEDETATPPKSQALRDQEEVEEQIVLLEREIEAEAAAGEDDILVFGGTDISMDLAHQMELQKAVELQKATRLSPTPKKNVGDTSRSYGIFNNIDQDYDSEEDCDYEREEDSENVVPPTPSSKLADKLSAFVLRSPSTPRGFGRELEMMLPSETEPEKTFSNSDNIPKEDEIPIDPVLLSQDPFYTETPLPPTTAPLRKAEEPSPVRYTSRKRRSSGFVKTPGILTGCVVFVDAYTTSGTDASAGLQDTLRALGATVRQQWNWNGESDKRIGITHVVFREGSARTLEKVKMSMGLVACVAMGWVKACEAEGKWVSEEEWGVDLTIAPRGGQRRRRSMDPKILPMSKPLSRPLPCLPPRTTSDPAKKMVAETPRKQTTSNTMMMRTEPGMKHVFAERLASAKKRSMLFAPKIGSPLAKRSWGLDDSF